MTTTGGTAEAGAVFGRRDPDARGYFGACFAALAGGGTVPVGNREHACRHPRPAERQGGGGTPAGNREHES